MAYTGTPEQIAEQRRASYLRHREKRLVKMRAYNAAHAEQQRARKKERRNGPDREKILEAKRAYHAANRDAIAAKRKSYFEGRKALKAEYDRQRRARLGDLLKAQQKAWRAANREELNAQYRAKRKASPQYAIANNLRCRMNVALRAHGLRRDKTLEALLGCTIPELMAHLERQFTEGMTWDNRGRLGKVWHVDHKIPCASFDLTDPAQRATCFHYTNLQPLWAKENVSKGAKTT